MEAQNWTMDFFTENAHVVRAQMVVDFFLHDYIYFVIGHKLLHLPSTQDVIP